MPQILAPKEAAQFRQVIRNYEEKQYKRGLKTADLILKKNPKHGETTAMKALILNGQGKTDEAFALAKEALTADMKSHICWHVYGILYRANKNFEEASKAYKFALKLEPGSQQIQRDLATLQVQMRDYQGYIQTRSAMLQARPQVRQAWTALAIAHHLAGNLEEAENILNTYEGTLKATPSRHDFEHSEAVMYTNALIAEQGDYQRALDHLETKAKHNLDRLAVLENRAEYLLKLGKNQDASEAYRTLIDRNPDRAIYYLKLAESLDIQEGDAEARQIIYSEYAQKYPRCDAPRRIPLDFLTGEDFHTAAKKYMFLMLDKGVPSTFANLKHLYSDSFKKDTLAGLAQDYLKSQTSDATSKDKGQAAALYYLAQHYNYHLSRDLRRAAEYIKQAIEKDPKSVDFHMTNARIYKHSGNLQKAAEVMDHARSLDLKDRYINSKAAKYQLRNNESDRALKTVGLFTRADTVGGPLADLLDMQCIWFLTEDGEAYARKDNFGLALKRFHAVMNIFDVWQEDQFDFHSFSIRKGQIRAYIDMIRWEDHVFDHPFYTRAALDAIDVYLTLAENPFTAGINGENGDDADDALARKKAQKKAKKEQQRIERETAEKQAKQDPNKATQEGDSKKKDDDPFGLTLASTTDPLGAAHKLLLTMLQASPKNVNAQQAGFEIYMRRRKYVLALRCLNAILLLNPAGERTHECVVTFANFLKTTTSLPDKVLEVLKAEFKIVDLSIDLKEFNDRFSSTHSESPSHLHVAIRVKRLLGQDQEICTEQLISLLEHDNTVLSNAVDILSTLKQWRSPGVKSFRTSALTKWPEASRLA